MMKKILSALLTLVCVVNSGRSQSVEVMGKPVAQIFTDFHYNLDDTANTSGFGLNRAYLGYNFLPKNNFSGSIILNIGNPDDLSEGSVHRRYAYIREASVSWSKEKFNISMGITTTRIFDFQQKFWGMRYIANTYQSLNGYGFVADLGMAMDYKFNDLFSADLTVMNGEGYCELQCDNNVKTSFGLTITPGKLVAIRLYGDFSRPQGTWQHTLIGFAGLRNEILMIGAEASHKSNLDMTGGHNSWGLSGTGALSVYKNTQVFVRYDYSTSCRIQGDIYNWNYLKDGNFSVFGLQYTFNQNVKAALNFQSTDPCDPGKQNSNAIFLNSVFSF